VHQWAPEPDSDFLIVGDKFDPEFFGRAPVGGASFPRGGVVSTEEKLDNGGIAMKILHQHPDGIGARRELR
jgi:hypothetical protein